MDDKINKKKKKCGENRTYFNYQVREYEKNLIHKLPNELRSYVVNYNQKNSDNFGLLIDNNDYS